MFSQKMLNDGRMVALIFQRFCRPMATTSTSAQTKTKQPAPLSALPANSMRAWAVQAFNLPLVQTEMAMPELQRDDQVLLRVMAASINPIDILLCQGYGRQMLSLLRRMGISDSQLGLPDPRRLFSALAAQTQTSSDLEQERLPLVPGHDCSAEVVQVGGRVQGVDVGDQVIAVIPIEWQGCHADYVLAPAYAIAPKPSALKHTEAAALPYAACTAWAALVNAARIQPDNAKGLRLLIHGGSGGVGTMAIQMLKCWGAQRVVATCSKKNLNLLEELGAIAVDYNAEDAKERIIANGPYEVILDCAKSELSEWSDSVLGTWRRCAHITLNSPLLGDTDRYGMAMGLASFGAKMAARNLQGPLRKGQLFVPAFFTPSPDCLQWVALAAQEGRLRPILDDKVFPFTELGAAFDKVALGHARGKTVVNFGSTN